MGNTLNFQATRYLWELMVVTRTPIGAVRVRRVQRLDCQKNSKADAARSGDTAGMVPTIATHVVRMALVQIAIR